MGSSALDIGLGSTRNRNLRQKCLAICSLNAKIQAEAYDLIGIAKIFWVRHSIAGPNI
jgi:hypothetical protein